jgi:hypothetical protein
LWYACASNVVIVTMLTYVKLEKNSFLFRLPRWTLFSKKEGSRYG